MHLARSFTVLSAKLLLLEWSHNCVADRTECERKWKADVTSIIWQPDLSSNRPLEPDLCHAHDRSHDAKQERGDSRYTWREAGWSIESRDIVSTLGESEVLRKCYSFIDGKPIALRIISDKFELAMLHSRRG